MHITLSTTEAREHLLKRFEHLGADITIDIQDGLKAKPVLDLMELVRAVDSHHPSHMNKIPAIKAVRARADALGFSLGLAEAKWFIERLIK
jgi:hypothetical protein